MNCVCTLLPHALGNVTINVQREGCSVVTQALCEGRIYNLISNVSGYFGHDYTESSILKWFSSREAAEKVFLDLVLRLIAASNSLT